MRYHLLLLLSCVSVCNITTAQEPAPTPQWRPLYHFTPEKNWTNDPNGPILINGVFHLYNQQNPFANVWGHMSWGHATSTDLVHWKHLPIAIPETIDKDTTLRFSGCVVIDSNNTSGLCSKKNCLVAIYTADQPNLKKESQFIAYSNDNGNTYTNYSNNPVIDLNKKDFRDPSVTWNKTLKKWLMVVALPTEHKVSFYVSSNLIQWQLLSQFGPQGYTSAAWECPSLMELPVEGTGKTRWVLTVSAAGAEKGVFIQYFVGRFDGRQFINDNPDSLVLGVDDGDCFYAAIPWNGTPRYDNLYIGWLMPGRQPTSPWRGQMSIPRDLALRSTANGLRLVQHPTARIANKLPNIAGKAMFAKKEFQVADEEKTILASSSNSYWVDAMITIAPGADMAFAIGKQKDTNETIDETLVGYDAKTGTLYIDKSHAGYAKADPDRPSIKTATQLPSGSVRIQLLVDKSSIELFWNNGEKVITTYFYPGENASALSILSRHGSVSIQSLKVYDLSRLLK